MSPKLQPLERIARFRKQQLKQSEHELGQIQSACNRIREDMAAAQSAMNQLIENPTNLASLDLTSMQQNCYESLQRTRQAQQAKLDQLNQEYQAALERFLRYRQAHESLENVVLKRQVIARQQRERMWQLRVEDLVLAKQIQQSN